MKRDVIGYKFNRLTAIEFSHRDSKSRAYWKFECECGNEHIANLSQVKVGGIKSCGCLGIENNAMRKHGLSKTHTYRVWVHIMDRLTNKDHVHYDRYGGRGITIYKEWEDFEKFYEYFGEIPKGYELDRIDNNGNYEPNNMRVTTRKANAQNTKACKYWVIDGVTYPSKRDAAKALGVAASTIRGWCTGKGGIKQRENCYCELKYKGVKNG